MRTIVATAFLLGSVCLAQPQVAAVANNYSYTPAGMPNFGIAQGSIFDIFGSGLATSTSTLQSVPLPTTLAGATVTVTVGTTSTQAILYFASPAQIAAILPSSTPVGTGQITVAVGGQTSAPSPITVVQSAFGLLTLNGVGNGPAAVYDVNYRYNGFANAANAGDYLTLWGSGLGPITGDETKAPAQTNLSTPIEVDIGGQVATVVYHGRSGYPGLDQVNVVVPAGVSGCYVSVVVRSGNIVSNFGTISVAPSGRYCAEATLGLSASQIQTVSSQPGFNVGQIIVVAGQNLNVSAGFARFTQAQFAARQPGGNASLGTCVVYNFNGSAQTVANPISPAPLNAGASLAFTPPAGAGFDAATLPLQGGSYAASLPRPTSGNLKGTYSLAGTGGADVGPFSAQLTWPGGGSFTIFAPNNLTSAPRSQDLTVNWTVPGSTVAGEFVQISGSSAVASGAAGALFYCSAPLAPGQFTIPSAVLLSLPATPAGGSPLSYLSGTLIIPGNFSATGVDLGLSLFASTSSNPFQYQ